MGLFSWLFPSDDDRMATAEQRLEQGEFASARDEIQGIEGPRAEAIRDRAHAALKTMNIEEAIALARTGAFDRAREHLELATSFAARRDPDVMEGRRKVRKLRVAARANAKPPTGLALAKDILTPEGDDPLFSLPPDDPRVRYALRMEAYPEDLRERLVGLGGAFAAAVTRLEDGAPAEAVRALGAFVEQEPAARYERARAALAAGQLPLASSDLAAFNRSFGHRRIGATHTGSLLVQILLRQRRADEALQVAEASLVATPDDLAMSAARAYALEGVGDWAAADEAARDLVRKAPRDLAIYRLMARCRLRGDKRLEAAQVLERSLERNCKSGKCGCQPFDVEAGRMLARIYLEDRIEPARAAELLQRIHANVKEPGPYEAFLEALSLRNQVQPGADEAARRALAMLPDGAPLRQTVFENFPALAPAQLA